MPLTLSPTASLLPPLLLSEECLSRALYCLEMAWHPSFDPASGTNCRLDFEVEENRPLFVALFRHIQVWTKVCKQEVILRLSTFRDIISYPLEPKPTRLYLCRAAS